jgi:hypothetical protein
MASHIASLAGLPFQDDRGLVDAHLDGAILAGAPLASAILAEVFWSGGTLWPEGMASLMQDRSEELRPEVLRVVGLGGAYAEIEGSAGPTRITRSGQCVVRYASHAASTLSREVRCSIRRGCLRELAPGWQPITAFTSSCRPWRRFGDRLQIQTIL